MIHWKRKKFRVLEKDQDPTDKIVDRILGELRKEDHPETEAMEEAKRQKRKRWKKTGIIAGSIVAVSIGIYLLINLQTYTSVRTVDTYPVSGAASNEYKQFADGVLKYSRDGISYLDQKGSEVWNQPYQIQNPVVDVNETSGAVADKGGNAILVFNEEGLRGEIETDLPIERISVSEQGIVSVILIDESSSQILCYDAAGNILVEHKTSVNGTGYPMDAALSPDGEILQVLYLYTQDGTITSRVAYYNFGQEGESETDHQVTEQEYKDVVMADGFFMNQSVSAAVGDNMLTIFRGKSVPEEAVKVEIDKEIKSVFHSQKYIGMILKNEGKEGYELRLYNDRGQMAMSEDFSGDYSNVKICGSQVIMYDGKNCSIFTRGGIQKFEGEMNSNILEIFPVAGVNKYIVMNENGMEVVRLVK
ncbi:DUF5711 family protein [Merdimonas faecis]|uniref:DUF5711 family protein n=1 Tax=Merdimonas faecis TaxID=1653435 RepID=UPI0023F737C3|nr:DUF5711 family protein [Merdimonas faecis]